jgi:hypothetical protein
VVAAAVNETAAGYDGRMPSAGASTTRWRQLTLAILIAAAVLIPRGIIIARAHGPTFDENYHLYRGLLFLRGDWSTLHEIRLTDNPLLGEALLSVPAYLNGEHIGDPFHASAWSSDVPPPDKFCYVLPDRIRIETAIWKSVLFAPALGVIFVWIRSIYSLQSAWLALTLVLIEPTLAAMIPVLTPDSLAVEAIVIGLWAVWRYIENPTIWRQVGAASAVAAALLMKSNGLILPMVAVLLAAVHWLVRDRHDVLQKCKSFCVAAMLTICFAWILLRADVSVPFKLSDRPIFHHGILSKGIPGGMYVESLWDAIIEERAGHDSLLLGQTSQFGWWYYFPAVATFKVPIGFGVLGVLAIMSLGRIKPRYEELPLAISAAAWGGAGMMQHIDIGFRHCLPAEVFLIMLGARVLAQPGWIRGAVAWVAVGAAAIDVALWTPDYLSYLNFPRQTPWLDISDSNLDWGQGIKEVRRWIEAHPDDGHPIYLLYFGPRNQNLFQQLGRRLAQYKINGGNWISRPEGCLNPVAGVLPDHGILIVSAVEMSGLYQGYGPASSLARHRPDDTIGHCLLVYDLDRLASK